MTRRTLPRTIIIGLDGATFDLILPWSEAGYLPTLTRLMRNGAYGVLDSFPNMNSAAAWSSIVTGTNAGKHGVFDFGEQVNPNRAWHPITALDRHRDPFWRILSAAGKCVGVMNVPISYPADAVNGFVVSGMDAPSISSKGVCFPNNFLEQLHGAGIDYVLDVHQLNRVHQRELNHMPMVVRAMVEARTRAFLYGMAQFQCDVGMVVFIATDRMQHYYWGPNDNLFDHSWTPLRELYQLLDECIAEILARLGPASNVFIISDHGFGPRRKAKNEVVVILEQTGLLARQRASTNDTVLRKGLKLARRFIPEPLRYRLALRLPHLRRQALTASAYGNVNLKQSKTYMVSFNSGLRINLQHREEFGIVPPSEFEQVREQAYQVLSNLIDPITGKPAIRRVWRREELYSGPFAESAPDLTVQWAYEDLVHGLMYRGAENPITVPAASDPNSHIVALHRPEGVLIAHGPSIRRGAKLEPKTQYNIAPTVLYLQEQPIPDDMDGHVLQEMITEEELTQHPIETITRHESDIVTNRMALDDAEQNAIEERLRGLGYIE